MKPLTRRTRLLAIPLLALAALAAAPARAGSFADGAAPASGGGVGGRFGGTFGLAKPAEETFGDSRDEVKVSVVVGRREVLPDSDVPVAIVLDISPKWHVWTSDQPFVGDAAGFAKYEDSIHTSLKVVSATPGVVVHAGFVAWPPIHGVPMDLGSGEKTYGVFEGRSVISVPITVAATAAPGPARVLLKLTFQACEQTCLQPATVELPVEFTVVALGTAIASQPLGPEFATFPSDVFARIRAGEKAPAVVEFRFFRWTFTLNAASGVGYLALLLVAALGGLLLNFTPCVLPVIPLKIMGLSSAAGSRRRCFTLGLAMTLGVVAFWSGLGLAIATVSGFTSTSQLFHDPRITIAVGLVIAAMAVGMCGLFNVRLPQFVYSLNPQHDSHIGSFGFGVMTAVLSTPCTAPLMGAAAAWAATQPPATTMTVFATIGAGMALPYLVLASFPQLVRRMPRSGPASDVIKQVMGLLLLAAAAYFVGAGVSGLLVRPGEPPNKLFWWVVAGFGAAAGLWLAWRTVRITPSLLRRAAFCTVGLVIAALSIQIGRLGTDKGPIDWVYFTPERFAEAKRSGNAVLMDFTAEWCANCKSMEALVLHRQEIVERLGRGSGIVPIKVDLTGANPDGVAMRDSLGFRSIPLLAVFSADGAEVFKSEAYTPSQVVEAIAEATGAAGTVAAAGR